jgi:hypothetical protein
MKKVIYTLLTLALCTFTCEINSAPLTNQPTTILSSQTTTTDIFNFLVQNLGLTTTQKPAVKQLVDEAGVLTTKLNSETAMTAAEKSTAKTGIVNDLIKKLGEGVLKSAQTTKLGTLATQLTTMFSALK